MTDPYKKLKLVNQKHKKYLSTVGKEVRDIINMPGPLEQRANAALDVLDTLSGCFSEVVACKKGCAHCCRQSVVIFEWEADKIAEHSGRVRNHFSGHGFNEWGLKERAELVDAYAGVSCPFLVNDECSVYPVRPLSCRVHLSLADDAVPCDIINNPGAKVPYVNMEQARFAWAILMLNENQRSGDIREFFCEA